MAYYMQRLMSSRDLKNKLKAVEAIKEGKMNGLTVREMSKSLRLSQTTICKYMKLNVYSVRDELYSVVKLEQRIWDMDNKGMDEKDIAQELGLAVGYVHKVKEHVLNKGNRSWCIDYSAMND